MMVKHRVRTALTLFAIALISILLSRYVFRFVFPFFFVFSLVGLICVIVGIALLKGGKKQKD